MFECRNDKEPNCKGKYRTKHDEKTPVFVYCEFCEHRISIRELQDEQIDHDIKNVKENK